jgi:hypothetical protein
MIDIQQVDSMPISAKKVAISLAATSIIGFIVALTAWSLLFTASQAVAIVSIGRYDQTPNAFIEEPQSVIERIRSPNFAAAVSARAGISELSTLLPGKQYGGGGAITARGLRDPNLIEIRINLPQPELALTATTAVVDELIANHEAKTLPLIQNLQSALTILDGHESEIVKASDSIAKHVSGLSQNEEADQNSSALLSARALTESGLSSLVKNKIDLEILLSNIRRSQVIAVPTVTTTKASFLYQTLAVGTFAGLLAGLLLLQMFPDLFRTDRLPLRVDQPDPA